MVDVSKLNGIIAERNETKRSVAIAAGMTPKSFYNKMKTGNFYIGEVERIIDFLKIEDPITIFFKKGVT